jgi:flagellar biosynthesis protein FlhF
MQTKAYFANSVPAALEVARRELGPDAMLVGSTPAPPHARHFGRLEVTFAWKPASGVPEVPLVSPAGHVNARSAAIGPGQSQGGDLEDIRRQLRALRSAVGAVLPARTGDGLVERLTDAGIDPEISQELAAAASHQTGDSEANLFAAMVKRIHLSPFVAFKPGEHRTLAFIGPPGRGKTTTLIKVAILRALVNRIPIRVYTAGAHGVGCGEQMAHYCSILGSPHQSFESLESLDLALRGEPWKGMTLVDTPGLSPAETEELSAFSRFFSRHAEFETHLVLRAESRYADMLTVIERFSGFRPARLLFTGMDETPDYSAMVNTLIRTSLPITFEGKGGRIPEDLAEADAVRLVRALLAPRAYSAMSATQRAAA